MDFRNKSIPFEQLTSFDVNKAIQRSLTKACARHGLGLYIYAGEDIPQEMPKAPAATKDELISKVIALCEVKGMTVEDLCKKVKVKDLEQLSSDRLEKAMEYVKGL